MVYAATSGRSGLAARCGVMATILLLVGLINIASGFQVPTQQRQYKTGIVSKLFMADPEHRANSKNNGALQDEEHPMAKTTRLTHAMLKVPSVDATVKYWTDQGGYVVRSRERKEVIDGETDTLQTAFVSLGHSQKNKDDETTKKCAFDKTQCFSLELLRAMDPIKFKLGNVISYIGVSMLLQFQSDLLGVIKGVKPTTPPLEPNGIKVRSSASAPGDFLARFTLKSNNLSSTVDFYTKVLGMQCAAQDDCMVCLRYAAEDFPGVPTTLVFEATDEKLEHGNCFDHLALETACEIEDEYSRIQQSDAKIFMKPTEMFGKNVMGVIDPNGYKVVLASSGE